MSYVKRSLKTPQLKCIHTYVTCEYRSNQAFT